MPGLAAPKKFRAQLSGKNEVPRVRSPAKGDLKLTVSGNEISYELNVKRITSPTAANIHRGRKGETGPPVAGLFGGPTKTGPFSGILDQGVITEKSLLGDLQGRSVADLVRLIKSGEAYVNILTETYPAGEIRGQIK
ncbi:MAG: hypothetical protein A2075_09770 [Geobacteraceae bacterium GWC2_58_44]|nr:MAG: hypothetical protein A2075_09770 [Geobacteraceae bacterium GWC2_58_44]